MSLVNGICSGKSASEDLHLCRSLITHMQTFYPVVEDFTDNFEFGWIKYW